MNKPDFTIKNVLIIIFVLIIVIVITTLLIALTLPKSNYNKIAIEQSVQQPQPTATEKINLENFKFTAQEFVDNVNMLISSNGNFEHYTLGSIIRIDEGEYISILRYYTQDTHTYFVFTNNTTALDKIIYITEVGNSTSTDVVNGMCLLYMGADSTLFYNDVNISIKNLLKKMMNNGTNQETDITNNVRYTLIHTTGTDGTETLSTVAVSIFREL